MCIRDSIASIKEPAEKVQLAAVQKNPEYIRHIESPTVKVQHMAIQGNADTCLLYTSRCV